MGYCEDIKAKDVICRKAHECGWCAEPIKAGWPAHYRVYTFDGDFTTDYMHPECHEAMKSLPFTVAMDGWYPGDYVRGSTEWR